MLVIVKEKHCFRTGLATTLLLILVAATGTGSSGDNSYNVDYADTSNEDHILLKNAIVIQQNHFVGLDCDFNEGQKCWWNWDKDNYTDGATSFPGQNGFYSLNPQGMENYNNKWRGQFFGPSTDSRQMATGKKSI
jgi:hypothetical protein